MTIAVTVPGDDSGRVATSQQHFLSGQTVGLVLLATIALGPHPGSIDPATTSVKTYRYVPPRSEQHHQSSR
jgi:hypothetical protein